MIAFSKFMQENNEIYYENANLGLLKDFTTAPEISPLFSECIACLIVYILQENKLQNITLCELGPGKGTYIENISTILKKFEINHEIFLLEKSQSLRLDQNKKIEAKYFENIDEMLGNLNDNFVMLANEFFDALPVRVFKKNENFWELNAEKKWEKSEEIKEIESFNFGSYEWLEWHECGIEILKKICKKLAKGMLLITDYGYSNFKPGKTLQAIQNGNFKKVEEIEKGSADLSCHVPFGLFKKVVESENIFSSDPIKQRDFLIGLGIKERFKKLEKESDKEKVLKLKIGIERLINPIQMGEIFGALACGALAKSFFGASN